MLDVHAHNTDMDRAQHTGSAASAAIIVLELRSQHSAQLGTRRSQACLRRVGQILILEVVKRTAVT